MRARAGSAWRLREARKRPPREGISEGPRAALPGACIGREAVASAPSACAAAGAGVGASRETLEGPSLAGTRIGHETAASVCTSCGRRCLPRNPEEPWANEALTPLSDMDRGFKAALRQSGFVAGAADAGVGAPRETPAEPKAGEAWALESDAES